MPAKAQKLAGGASHALAQVKAMTDRTRQLGALPWLARRRFSSFLPPLGACGN